MMKARKKYIEALKALIKAHREVSEEAKGGDQAQSRNPFDIGTPENTGLSRETFISDEELTELEVKLKAAADDNRKFKKLYDKGTELLKLISN